jgi:hypothetical protein
MNADNQNDVSLTEKNNGASKHNHTVDYEFANSVSLAALVKTLISKGIITIDELITSEREFRHQNNINSKAEMNSSLVKKKIKRKKSLLRRYAVRHRWSRRLTTRLLGWHWKKVAVSSNHNNDTN